MAIAAHDQCTVVWADSQCHDGCFESHASRFHSIIILHIQCQCDLEPPLS